ncbi:MAG: hypothetical protein PHG83_00175 [Patescibacteria group bacterium]|nr:hypothetical protein [Patescibacteria group bacterium]
MINQDQINSEQLNNPEFKEELQKEVQEIIFYLENKKAKQLAGALEKALSRSQLDPDLNEEYKDLISGLKCVAMQRLNVQEIADFLQYNLAAALKISDLPVLSQLKSSLISFNPWGRDSIKKELMNALNSNNQILFPEEMEEKNRKTIANYLNDYHQILGAEEISNIKQAEYFMKHLSGLSPQNRAVLEKLFGIYEYFKIDSKSPQAFADDLTFVTDKGTLQIIQNNRLVDIMPRKINKTANSSSEEISPLKSFDDEIEKLKKQQVMAPPININQAVDTAITKVGLTFPDEILEKRFKNVVFSYLREVRGEIETRIVLKRPQKIGGVELDETTVDKVMDILKQEKPMIKVEPMGNIPQIELAEGLKQPEETIQKFTRMEKPAEKTVPEIKPVSSLPKMEEEKFLPQPEETKEKLLKEKFEQETLKTPVLEQPAPIIKKPQPMTQTYADKNTDLRGQGDIQIKENQPVIPEIKPVLPPVFEKKIEEPSFIKAAEDKKTAPNLFTAVVEKPKTDLPVEILKKEEISGPEEITGVLKELDQLPAEDSLFVLDEDAEDKFKLPIKELPKEEPKPIIKEPKIEEIKKEIKPQPQAEIFIHRPPREPAMSKMEEIKVTPRVSGPIEELQGVTLQDFRRWGSSEQAVQKIKEKIDLLGEESLVKKSEGIKAWKESEINKLYLDIGTESIDKGISVSEVIILRQKENRKTLNEEEFDKVVELNQNLRF